jgi:hypothetical protein
MQLIRKAARTAYCSGIGAHSGLAPHFRRNRCNEKLTSQDERHSGSRAPRAAAQRKSRWRKCSAGDKIAPPEPGTRNTTTRG